MTRRALVGLGAALLVALTVLGLAPSPAQAAQAPGISISSPGAGEVLTGPVTIAGQATMNGGTVRSVTITLSAVGDKPLAGPMGFDGSSNTLPFSWTPNLPMNGEYTMRVDAVGRENIDFNGDEMSTVSRSFKLEAPPATPANVKAVVDQAKRTVTITWNANPEPDLIGYGVYRKGNATALAIIKKGDPTKFVHQLGSLPAGVYEYEVLAARPKADGSCCMASPAAPAKATVTSPPPSTTTTTEASPSGPGSRASTTTTTAAAGARTATRGKADLSGFTALLPNGGGRLPTPARTPDVDPGFSEDLPFQAPAGGRDEPVVGEDDGEQALGQELASSDDDSRPTSLLFMAAGLLVTVVLMHLLWLREEVNRDLPVEAVEPAES